jgi:flagellar basal body-associated protein FliL
MLMAAKKTSAKKSVSPAVAAVVIIVILVVIVVIGYFAFLRPKGPSEEEAQQAAQKTEQAIQTEKQMGGPQVETGETTEVPMGVQGEGGAR